MDTFPIFEAIITAIIPFLIAALKKLHDRIPKAWLPVAALLAGAIAQAIEAVLTGGQINPIVGLIMGAVAIGLREVFDQLIKAGQAVWNARRLPRLWR